MPALLLVLLLFCLPVPLALLFPLLGRAHLASRAFLALPPPSRARAAPSFLPSAHRLRRASRGRRRHRRRFCPPTWCLPARAVSPFSRSGKFPAISPERRDATENETPPSESRLSRARLESLVNPPVGCSGGFGERIDFSLSTCRTHIPLLRVFPAVKRSRGNPRNLNGISISGRTISKRRFRIIRRRFRIVRRRPIELYYYVCNRS